MFLTPAERTRDHEARGWWQGRSVDALFQESAAAGGDALALVERVAVAVAPGPGETPDLSAIADWLAAKGCAIFKRPEHLVALERLPRNAMNKVPRNQLRAEVLERPG